MKQEVLKALNEKKISSKKGWIVFFDDDRLVMNSGKLIWDEKHHASAALLNSLKDVIGMAKTRDNNIELQLYIQQLEQEGRIHYSKIG